MFFWPGVYMGRGGGGQPNADSYRQGGGGGCQKLLKDCRHPLWMTPYFELLSSNTCISHPNWELLTKSWENDKSENTKRETILRLESFFSSFTISYTLIYIARNICLQGFWANILWYGQNSQWFHSIFPNGNCFSQFIDRFLKF